MQVLSSSVALKGEGGVIGHIDIERPILRCMSDTCIKPITQSNHIPRAMRKTSRGPAQQPSKACYEASVSVFERQEGVRLTDEEKPSRGGCHVTPSRRGPAQRPRHASPVPPAGLLGCPCSPATFEALSRPCRARWGVLVASRGLQAFSKAAVPSANRKKVAAHCCDPIDWNAPIEGFLEIP